MTRGDLEVVDVIHVGGQGDGGPEAAAGRAGEHVHGPGSHVGPGEDEGPGGVGYGAAEKPPQELETESPGADSRAGGPQEPPAGSFEAYSAMMEVFGTSCSKVATASPAPSIATLRFPPSLADS